MKNHIEEYFMDKGEDSRLLTKQLFEADEKDVDIKTDLTDKQIVLINKLKFNNELLKKKGLNPVFDMFIYNYLRLLISKDRKSRGEFVNVNRQAENPEQQLQNLSNLNNVFKAKK